MIGFIIGMFVCWFIGVGVMALMNASSKADEQFENYKNKKLNK